jgi:hypothetical protein
VKVVAIKVNKDIGKGNEHLIYGAYVPFNQKIQFLKYEKI